SGDVQVGICDIVATFYGRLRRGGGTHTSSDFAAHIQEIDQESKGLRRNQPVVYPELRALHVINERII
ncbi:hypothetical protein PJK45_29910, partial [Mycobacterium kansasii]